MNASLFCGAVRTGDVRSFNTLMERWERVFITKGTYLLMEKCLMLVYRNLVKKMSVEAVCHCAALLTI